MNIVTKGGGEKDKFLTSAQRDSEIGKPNYRVLEFRALDWAQASITGVRHEIDSTNPPITGKLPEKIFYTIAKLTGQDHHVFSHPDFRPDLISDLANNRQAHLMGRGAKKYGDNNWRQGMPLSRTANSLWRHLMAWELGDTSEDHLAAVRFNVDALMEYETMIAQGKLPESYADAGPMRGGDWLKEDNLP